MKYKTYKIWYYWDGPGQDVSVSIHSDNVPTKEMLEIEEKMGWSLVYYEIET